ncbi:uncharacterized protein BT62DRAFT_1078253 [Guyanagaster necrorhizus]|uniref:Uncharacterized protein n=1 Tax=Guyanagaster necrorhizus TaxID=856835 RepID=A0A9P8AQ94_9AGAR|nr:uncharacterized protein BT62DRAFT_1078253 [Guyanagaster necrorhizus MCA 3950]KAG7443765.1 hypothetical protein BT62DRAFT_1078253 [Guyanagaster necrorhizus MCA 3950]
MESLDLNTLAGSLPTAHQNAEAELLNSFKAAALSITTLYRSSRDASKRAYSAGYAAACQDLLAMIQRGVSVGGIEPGMSAESNGMSIGRVMDWIDARLDAVKSRQEEEVEEEEKEKERGRKSVATAPPSEAKVKAEPKEQIPPMPTSNSPWPRVQRPSPQPSTPSPPPPPPSTLRQTQRSTHRAKPTSSFKGGGDSPTISPPLRASDYPFNLVSDDTLSVPSFPVPDVVAGAKRRHAVMMMLDSSSSPVSTASTTPSSNHGSGSGGNRRRTRSTRSTASHLQNQNVNSIQLSSEAMDIEDDNGRERKRVARR